MDEIDAIEDIGLSNLDGEVIMLIDALYGNRDSGTEEKRKESRDKLKTDVYSIKLENLMKFFKNDGINIL